MVFHEPGQNGSDFFFVGDAIHPLEHLFVTILCMILGLHLDLTVFQSVQHLSGPHHFWLIAAF